MSVMKRTEGYASFTVFVMILSLAGLILSASQFMYQHKRSIIALGNKTEQEALFMETARSICLAMVNDTSQEADSPFDQVWTSLESDEMELSLTELSSRLNPNFDGLYFWEESNLRSRIKSSITLKEWESERISVFSFKQNDFKDKLLEEDWDNLYSLYTLLNVNTAPSEVIEGYLRQNNYPENTISFTLSKIRQKKNKNEYISQRDISNWLAEANRKAGAVLNSQSKININFIDPLLLETVLSTPWMGETVDNYLVMKNNILNARSTNELTEQDLREILSCDEKIKDQILMYLGSKSWFWKLSIANESAEMELILCRVPSLDDIPENSGIQIVNKKFTLLGDR